MEVLATAITEEKEVNKIKIGKEVKLSLFADDMTLYIEDSKDATRKLLELNEFGKVAVYKINTQKSIASVYLVLVNEKSERNSRNFSTYHPIKKIKYLGINLLKETNCRW